MEKKVLFFGKKGIICVKTIFLFIFFFVKMRYNMRYKTICDVLYHFSNFWKKSIICAEDLILREKNLHGKNVIICV